jgi:hypothetical protein
MNNLIAASPRGDGHAVLLLPALAHGDPYTAQVRQFPGRIGYFAHGWGLGTNLGPAKSLLDDAAERLVELSDRHRPVSLVGFSMGSLFARAPILACCPRTWHDPSRRQGRSCTAAKTVL